MDDLLTNTRVIAFGLIGIAFLYYSHLQAKKQWNKKAPKLPPNIMIRTVLACVAFSVIAFTLSLMLTTTLTYAVVNTLVLSAVFFLYIRKVIADVKNYHSSGSSR